MNKVNEFLFNLINHKLPSISFWIKVCIFLFIINILYQLIITGNFYSLIEENSNQLFKVISDGSSQNSSEVIKNTVNNPNLTVNTPGVTVYVPGVLDGLLAATAIKAGMDVAKSVPSPTGTFIVGAASALAIGSASKLCLKIGEHLGDKVSSSLDNNQSSKFLPSLELLTGKVEGLNEYPLNMLVDMSVLTSSALVFLVLMLNVFIATYLKDKDIFLILPNWINPNNILGRIIKFSFNRYINIWYTSRKFVLIISWIMLLFCLLIVKLGLIIILGSA